MSRTPSSFRQRDLTAALRAARAAGLAVSRVEVGRDGRIVVVVGGASSPGETSPGTDLDRELADWEARRDR